ncbi:MAG: hypothetical protein KA508_04670 [Gammaproteobacteria bacterium]|nr:hypothetical protein [Gammaproteobacteria bacterium]
MTYKLVACKALVKKTWVFSMVIILLTTAMVMGSALLFLMPYIKLGSYLAIPSYLKVIFSMTFVAIPFVILTVYLVFASSIAIIDDRGIWSSIRAGFALVSKRWWFTAIRLLVVAIITGLCLLGIYLITISILAVWCFFWGTGTEPSVVTETNYWMRLWMLTPPFTTSIREPQHIKDLFTWTFTAFFNPLVNALILAVLYDLCLRKAQAA